MNLNAQTRVEAPSPGSLRNPTSPRTRGEVCTMLPVAQIPSVTPSVNPVAARGDRQRVARHGVGKRVESENAHHHSSHDGAPKRPRSLSQDGKFIPPRRGGSSPIPQSIGAI